MLNRERLGQAAMGLFVFVALVLTLPCILIAMTLNQPLVIIGWFAALSVSFLLGMMI